MLNVLDQLLQGCPDLNHELQKGSHIDMNRLPFRQATTKTRFFPPFKSGDLDFQIRKLGHFPLFTYQHRLSWWFGLYIARLVPSTEERLQTPSRFSSHESLKIGDSVAMGKRKRSEVNDLSDGRKRVDDHTVYLGRRRTRRTGSKGGINPPDKKGWFHDIQC